MKILFLIIFSTITTLSLFSQDFIKKIYSDTVWCKISEINSSYIQFKKDSATYFLSTDSIIGYQLENFDYVEINDEKSLKRKLKGKSPNKYIAAFIPGIGENHGVGGVKILAGVNGTSGVFACIGNGDLSIYWKFGLQVNSDWFYFAASYGTMEFYTIGISSSNVNVNYGLTLEAGGLINLSRNKRFFIQLGIGYNIPEKEINPYQYGFYYGGIYLVSFKGIRPEIGIGIKF